MTRLLSMAGILVAGWMLYALVLFVGQRALMYPAPRPSGAPAPRGVARVMLPITGATIEAWLLRPTRPGSEPAPLLIFTHGNAELIDYWATEFDDMRAAGYAVLLVEYPGYGRSTGSPSEQSITDGALAAYDWVKVLPGIDSTRVIAYGRSLGGGAACALAARRPLAGLVLESSFASVRALAPRMGLPGALVRDPFDNLAALAAYRGPTLVMHGDRDTTIPPDHARQLAAAVPGAQLELLQCGHNDCRGTFALALAFLQLREATAPRLSNRAPARQR